MGPLAALGLGRFAYSLLLPAMRSSLHWSFATAGAMNTANAVGYLVGAMAAAPLARKAGTRRMFLTGLLITVLSLVATAASGELALLLFLRLVTGAAGALVFVAGASLTARAGAGASQSRAALLLGIYFAGAGLGIVISGLAVPALLGATSAGVDWRWGWVLLGTLAAVALTLSVPAALSTDEPTATASRGGRWPAGRLTVLLGAYAGFGVGYIAYVTFIVAFLKDHGANTIEVTAFWVVLGAAAIIAGFAWGPVLGRLRGGRGPALLLAVATLGALVPLLSAAPAAAYISAAFFGASFLSVVTAVIATARRSLHPRHWPAAIATLTIAFALGQCLGPVLAGALADSASGVRAGLILAVAVLAATTLICLAQRHRQPEAANTAA